MKLIKKTNDSYVDYILFVIAVFLWVFNAWHNQFGYKSIVDEGWYLLGLNQNQELGLVPTESFQIIRFLLHFFPDTLLSLRSLALFFVFLGTFVFFIASFYWLKKKHGVTRNTLSLFSVLMILGATAYVGRLYVPTIHYNQLQIFFVFLMVSLLLLTDVIGDYRFNRLFLLLLGFFSFFSIINILPSGVLVTLAILGVLLIKSGRCMKLFFQQLLPVLLGIVLAVLFYHFCIRSVIEVIKDFLLMSQTATQGGGYTFRDLILLTQDYLT